MLYVGLFNFHNEEESTHSQFIYFAEANDPEGAVEIFKEGIKKTARKQNVHICGEIYLESFIELKKLPPGGAMAFLQAMDEHEASSIISCSLPGGTSGLESYHWTEDGKGLDDVQTPFLNIPASKIRVQPVSKLT
jgi:hypothetical protein